MDPAAVFGLALASALIILFNKPQPPGGAAKEANKKDQPVATAIADLPDGESLLIYRLPKAPKGKK